PRTAPRNWACGRRGSRPRRWAGPAGGRPPTWGWHGRRREAPAARPPPGSPCHRAPRRTPRSSPLLAWAYFSTRVSEDLGGAGLLAPACFPGRPGLVCRLGAGGALDSVPVLNENVRTELVCAPWLWCKE